MLLLGVGVLIVGLALLLIEDRERAGSILALLGMVFIGIAVADHFFGWW
jgi:hypothetical protein